MANPNPSPENRFKPGQSGNPGGKPKNEERFDWWYMTFKSMTVAEFKEYEKSKPDDERTVAESLAYARVAKARNDLKEFQEVANRSEGMPVRRTDITSGGEKLQPATIIDLGNLNDVADQPEAESSS